LPTSIVEHAKEGRELRFISGATWEEESLDRCCLHGICLRERLIQYGGNSQERGSKDSSKVDSGAFWLSLLRVNVNALVHVRELKMEL
jgi:hypothetical protein